MRYDISKGINKNRHQDENESQLLRRRRDSVGLLFQIGD